MGIPLLVATILLTLLTAPAQAEGWFPSLAPNPVLPPVFMAVDMGRQRAILVRNQDQKLIKFRQMSCTTGMRGGGKLLEGDRKTPEGVYFLQGKASGGLDFNLFGNTAYPLNYPNPADMVMGKTGDGIMIHGRGRTFGPRQTLGCIVLENGEVDRLDRDVRINSTPVIIGEGFDWKETSGIGVPPDILMATRGWIKARERRDNSFFEIYDPARFEKSSGMSFAQFRQKTLREFSQREWVDIRTRDIQVIPGPGYMVSVFAQRTMPGGEEGWRRLYWMRKIELWKIVGEEWIPHRFGDGMDYAAVVSREIRDRIRECREAWDRGDLNVLMRAYDRTARRGDDEGNRAIEAALQSELKAKAPNPFAADPTVRITDRGVEVALKPGKGATRKLLFLPSYFDSWVIVREAS